MFGTGTRGSTQPVFFTEIILYVIVMKNLIPDDLPIIKPEPRKSNGGSLIINQVDY